ncbi:MAG: hypothetical protein RDU25_05510 [Patescibacteria group bacterium]|nr:hypothetical protein [Patescibacteria group bacterium]
MKKAILFATLAASLCVTGTALAAPTPIIPSKTVPQVTITPDLAADPIIKPYTPPKYVIDPSLLPSLTTSSDSGVQTIDPDLLKNLKPIPLPSITIPPELIKGPQISDIEFATDGTLLKISWTTDKTATSKVEYGTTDSYGKTLEDKTLTTDHQLIIPVTPGDLHLKLYSSNALKQTTASEDIAIAIPTVATEEAKTDATTDTTEEEKATEPEAPALTQPVSPPAPETQTSTPTSSSITLTNALLGGAVLLLVGLMAGFALRGKKKAHDDSVA